MIKIIFIFCGALILPLWPQLVSAKPVQVTDYLGNNVILEQPARRVVSLAPHITENLFALGLGSTIVGTVEYSDYPDAALDIPRIGGAYTLSLEKIISQKPDLVYVWLSGNGDTIAKRLKSFGIPVYLDNPKTLDDIPRSLKDLSVLGGKPQKGDDSAQLFSNRLAQLEKDFSKNSLDIPLRSFFQVWRQPLQTLSGKSIVSDLIKRCGGSNIFADEEAVAPTVSIESVIKRDPEIIFTGDSAIQVSVNETTEDERFWAAYPNISAVKNQRIVRLNPDHIHRHSPRILLGMNDICKAIAENSTVAP